MQRLSCTNIHWEISSGIMKLITRFYLDNAILLQLSDWVYLYLPILYCTALILCIVVSVFLKIIYSGVLLHGPPGCGKTLLAKAVAKEAGCRFINLDVASLTDKWYGESQKLASAVFTLATKIQPCIIFIDEIGKSYFTYNFQVTCIWFYMVTQ